VCVFFQGLLCVCVYQVCVYSILCVCVHTVSCLVCVSEWVSEWERECVCVREWVSESVSQWVSESVCVCVCMCVCERERERERAPIHTRRLAICNKPMYACTHIHSYRSIYISDNDLYLCMHAKTLTRLDPRVFVREWECVRGRQWRAVGVILLI
jgi:hypothetical protein